MEVAGLALGVYPAAVLAFEQFKVGAKYFNNWVQFRRKYEELIRDIEAQQLTFEELLFNLMCCGPDPYLKWIENDKDTFLDLVGDTSYPGWKDPKLKINLEMRLGDKYSWFIFTIGRIHKLLDELEAILSIENLATSEKTPHWWKYQWERVKKTLFAEENEEKWKEAKRLNDDLMKMLELADKHQAMRTSTGNSIANFFKTVQQNALCLHKVLEKAWHCCHTAHKVLLTLERRLQDRDSQFSLVFFLPQPQSAIDSSDQASTQEDQLESQVIPRAIEREVHIKKLEVVSRKEPSVSSVGLHTLSSADNCMSGALSPGGSSVSEMSTKQELYKSRSAEKQPNKSKWSIKSAFSSRFKRSGKLAVVASSESQDQEELMVTSSISVKVTFSQRSPSPESEVEVAPQIPELCTAIHSASMSGYLQDEEKMQYHLSPPASQVTERPISTITLKELLRGHHRTFPRQKRLIVAANLASSFIQLQRTAWLSPGWGKETILFDKQGQIVVFEKPYLATQFLSTAPDTQVISDDSEATAEKDLNVRIKASLESLGIVLIELCFGEHIEKSSHKVQLRPSGDQPNHDFCLAIANAWTEEEILYEDVSFASPIENCLRFPDISRVRKGRYDEVLEDLYLSIAKPLHDEVLRQQMIMGTGNTGVNR